MMWKLYRTEGLSPISVAGRRKYYYEPTRGSCTTFDRFQPRCTGPSRGDQAQLRHTTRCTYVLRGRGGPFLTASELGAEG